MIGIRIEALSKTFPAPKGSAQKAVRALDAVSLEIEAGEIFFLLGPSGCGKTTLLRALAGFCEPDGGRIFFGDEEVTRLPAHRRRCGMVFQNYALWPHKTVAQNIAFGLEEMGVPKSERERRVAEALAGVRMEDCFSRHIHELSGGQQQRIALARALVVRPRCLLLDEPLSNLDAKLRLSMRAEIRRICKESGLTAVYVTHDQKEALAIADRMAVLEAGRVAQIGTPEAVYRRPNSRFVADFVGETNFLSARVAQKEAAHKPGALVAALDPADPASPEKNTPVFLEAAAEKSAFPPDAPVTLSIRPEALQIVLPDAPKPAGNLLAGQVEEALYLGKMAEYQIRAGGVLLKAHQLNPRGTLRRESPCALHVAPEDIVVLANQIAKGKLRFPKKP